MRRGASWLDQHPAHQPVLMHLPHHPTLQPQDKDETQTKPGLEAGTDTAQHAS